MESVVGVGLVLLFAVAIALIIKGAGERKKRISNAWEQLAYELEGDYYEGEDGWFSNDRSREIVAEMDGVEVRADTFYREHSSGTDGNSNRTVYTRVRARASVEINGKIKIYEEGLFSGLARAVGFQDLEIGDATFDDEFIVKAEDEEFAFTWINKTVRRRMLAAPEYKYELSRKSVFAEAEGDPIDVEPLRLAMRAVAAFADGRHGMMATYRKVAKHFGGKARKLEAGWAVIDVVVEGLPVRVETMQSGHNYFNLTTVTVVGPKLKPIALTYDLHEFSPSLPATEVANNPSGYHVWSYEPEAAIAQVTEAAHALISALEPAKVRIDEDQVCIYLGELLPSSKNIIAAIKLGALLAKSGTSGPYR